MGKELVSNQPIQINGAAEYVWSDRIGQLYLSFHPDLQRPRSYWPPYLPDCSDRRFPAGQSMRQHGNTLAQSRLLGKNHRLE